MTDTDRLIIHDWLAILLAEARQDGHGADLPAMMMRCAAAHYRAIDIETRLGPLKGDLPGFLGFLESEWGWVVTHDRKARTIVADENKPECVCPLQRNGLVAEASLCDCSCGFARMMFGFILQKDVHAEIVTSILRGGSRCVYRVSY